MRDWWEAHFLSVELLLSALSVVALAMFDGVFLENVIVRSIQAADRAALWATLAGIAGGLLGFVLASASIILGLLSSSRSWRVRMSDQTVAIWRVYVSTTKWLGALTVAALILLVLDSGDRANELALVALAFLVTASIVRLLRCIWILDRLLHLQVAKPTEL